MVAMDLKTFKDVKILHLIDLATPCSVGVMIEYKHKEVIVGKIFKHWIAIFGPLEQFFSDKGGEFNNNDIREMSELLNVKIILLQQKHHGPMVFMSVTILF